MSPYIVLFTCGMYSMPDRPSFNVDFPIFFCRNFYVWGAVCALVNVAVSCFPCLIVWGGRVGSVSISRSKCGFSVLSPPDRSLLSPPHPYIQNAKLFAETTTLMSFYFAMTEKWTSKGRGKVRYDVCNSWVIWSYPINSQTLEDTQFWYISQKYTLDKYTLKNTFLKNEQQKVQNCK